MITGLSLALMSNRFGLPMQYDLQILGAKYHVKANRLREPHRAYFYESTSCVGNLINPTVSESKKGKFLTTFRTVVSSVAKVCSLQNITLPTAFINVDFPH
jgi:hypothetical protein